MFGQIFNPENGFYRVTGKLVDMVILSVFWAVCSIPLFTIGPATAALYYAVHKSIRGEARNGWRLFFQAFRDNFKVGALTSLAALAAAFALLCLRNLLYLYGTAGGMGYTLYIAYCVLLLLPIGVLCYLFPVLSRFTFGVGGLLSTCGKLALAHLPSTVGMALLLVLAWYACASFWWPVVILPALLAWANSFLLERIFKPYLPKQEDPEEEPQ